MVTPYTKLELLGRLIITYAMLDLHLMLTQDPQDLLLSHGGAIEVVEESQESHMLEVFAVIPTQISMKNNQVLQLLHL